MRYDDFTIQSESYRKDFWNKMMKGQTAPYETMNKGAISSDTYVLPYDSNRKYMDVLKEECIFRQLATSIKSADSDLDIWVSDSDEQVEWAPSNTQQFIKDAAGQFDKKKVKCHKLAIITRMDRDFMQDVKFNMEKYLVKHFARRFGKAEEAAFVSGTGVDMPTGILHETDGAEVGITARANANGGIQESTGRGREEWHQTGIAEDVQSNLIWMIISTPAIVSECFCVIENFTNT